MAPLQVAALPHLVEIRSQATRSFSTAGVITDDTTHTVTASRSARLAARSTWHADC
jgi:hypothetical protein